MISEHKDILLNISSAEIFYHLTSQKLINSSKNNQLAQLSDDKFKMIFNPYQLNKNNLKSISYTPIPSCVFNLLFIKEESLPIGDTILLSENSVAVTPKHLTKNLTPKKINFSLSRLRNSVTTTTRKKFTPSCQHNLTPKENSTPSCQNTLTPQHNPISSCENLTTKLKLTPRCSTLCLDLGTTTGWALLTQTNIASSGSHNFKGSRFEGGGIRFLKFTRFLDRIFTTTPLSLVFFEEVRAHLGVDAAHIYGGFLAQLTAWCEQLKISYEGVAVGTIKRHVTGRGNASKADVIQSIRQRGHDPVDDNEADALGLAYWAIDNRLGGL